jgi:ribonuclease HI
MNSLTVYTDGACSGNPGPGGYAAIIIDGAGKETVISGGEKTTTNNRMEMLALIEALKKVHEIEKETGSKAVVNLFVDSQYVMKGATEWIHGWKKKNWKSTTGPVKNRELWEQIDLLMKGLTLKWVWVKGHAGDKYNEMADQAAVAEIEKLRGR